LGFFFFFFEIIDVLAFHEKTEKMNRVSLAKRLHVLLREVHKQPNNLRKRKHATCQKHRLEYYIYQSTHVAVPITSTIGKRKIKNTRGKTLHWLGTEQKPSASAARAQATGAKTQTRHHTQENEEPAAAGSKRRL